MQSTLTQTPVGTKARPPVSTKAPALDAVPVKRSLLTAVSNMSDNGQMENIGKDGMKQLLLQCETITDYCYLIRVINRYPKAVKAAEALASDPAVFLRAARIIEAGVDTHDIHDLVPLLVEAAMGDNVPAEVQLAVERAIRAYSPICSYVQDPQDTLFSKVADPALAGHVDALIDADTAFGTTISAEASRILAQRTGYILVPAGESKPAASE